MISDRRISHEHFLLAVALLALALVFVIYQINIQPVLAGTGENISGFAWSDTIGWTSFNSTSDGSASNYGVKVDGAGNLSGYAWSDNIGWISFNSIGICPSLADNPVCSPKLDRATGKLSGWAQACAGTVNGDCTGADRTDGWDGWISLVGVSPDYGVTAGNYDSVSGGCPWSGWAWGSSVIGWVSFGGANYGVSGNDVNACAGPTTPECSDGADNDGDGKKDDRDPGCYTSGVYDPNDPSELNTLPVCSNHFDDDGDGRLDATDPGCWVPPGVYDPNGSNESDSAPQCSNNFDDDGDNKIDYSADPGCASALDNNELDQTACSDNEDNDGDGFIDFPLDNGCSSASDTSEKTQCNDDLDNDGDTLKDINDSACHTDGDAGNPLTYDPTIDSERRIRIIETIPQ